MGLSLDGLVSEIESGQTQFDAIDPESGYAGEMKSVTFATPKTFKFEVEGQLVSGRYAGAQIQSLLRVNEAGVLAYTERTLSLVGVEYLTGAGIIVNLTPIGWTLLAGFVLLAIITLADFDSEEPFVWRFEARLSYPYNPHTDHLEKEVLPDGVTSGLQPVGPDLVIEPM